MRLALYVCLKNICDGEGGQDEWNGTPLDPPLFWLDNIFNIHVYLYGTYHMQFHTVIETRNSIID